MTVLLVNGSPHEHGCTDAALKHAASVLEEQGVHTEIFWIGSKPISGCIATSRYPAVSAAEPARRVWASAVSTTL
ncbi:nADPH-dependent FMN reductase [Eubacterium sp. CAG:115]|nr:nADPH-dependent FMN reductase [Eubacterium sp. CAG:115]